MKGIKATLKMGYWKSADLQTLHHHSKEWLSEIGFYKDEMQFMNKLLQKHFLFFYEKERRNIVSALANRLETTLKKDLNKLEKDVQVHEKQLAFVMESAVKNDERNYRAAHDKIDLRIGHFEESFKQAKKELFEIAEEVLKEEKVKLLSEFKHKKSEEIKIY